MPIAVRALDPLAMPPLPRKKFTRRECVELGKLVDLSRYELINGELLDKMGKNEPHMFALKRVAGWCFTVFGYEAVWHQGPIDVRPEDNPTSDPEPDVVVLRGVRTGRPVPEEIALLVEVADTSVGLDLGEKRELYARAGIGDYWVLDLPRRRMVVHREPVGGVYQLVEEYAEDERVSPLEKPEAGIVVGELLS